MPEIDLASRVMLLCDIDGVTVESPHEESWNDAANEWGLFNNDSDFNKFLLERVVGQPGMEGALAILGMYRSDDAKTYFERERVRKHKEKEVAAYFRNPVKQRHLDRRIANGEFKVYDDIINIILRARLEGIPAGAISASENAEKLLKNVSAEEVAARVGLNGIEMRGLNITGDTTIYDMFLSAALGAKSHWHGLDHEDVKLYHYCLARGMLQQARGQDGIPYTVVFEDAPKGIGIISDKDFYCIGISRKTNSGIMATKEDLAKAGAVIAYDEADLEEKGYEGVKDDISGIVSAVEAIQNATA